MEKQEEWVQKGWAGWDDFVYFKGGCQSTRKEEKMENARREKELHEKMQEERERWYSEWQERFRTQEEDYVE